MTSTSSEGSSVITLQFVLDLNIDVAEQEVQAAINAAGTFLPPDLPNPPIYSKTNPADAPILTLALTSNTLPLSKVEDLADTRLAQKISQLSGVGLVSISGGQKPAVRIQVNPTALSSYGLTMEDIRTAIAQANVNQAKGNFDGPHQAYTIGANDQLLTSDQYRPLIIAYRNGAPVQLSDVATVDRRRRERQTGGVDEPDAGSHPQYSAAARRQHHRRRRSRQGTCCPNSRLAASAVQLSILTDRTTTIRASVQDVQFELMLTIALVVMVIFLFLRTFAATVIPSVAVPLVARRHIRRDVSARLQPEQPVADGADDLDGLRRRRCHRHDREHHALHRRGRCRRCEAALKGSEQIGFTIVSLTVSLIAVLIPLLFMGDIVGRLFREFAVT